MTKANDNRVRQSLERARLRLKAETIELEKRRREYGAERLTAIAFLRVFCERYGDNTWGDEAPLVEILRDHLALPLNLRVAATLQRLAELEAAQKATPATEGATVVRAHSGPTRAPQRAIEPPQPPPRPPQSPQPPRPRLVEPGRHSVITIQAQERVSGRIGWKASCVCTWFSKLEEYRNRADQAGDQHLAIMRNAQPQGAPNHA